VKPFCLPRVQRKACGHLVILSLLIGGLTFAQVGTAAQEQKSATKNDASRGTRTEGSASEKPSDSSPTADAEKGKKLFMSNGCYECHGTVGQGSTSTGGVRIGPPAISFEDMVDYLHHPSGQMPPYTSKVISDQDLADIYAYLKSQPKPQPAKNIALLNP
jgi:mono/diheme cytochrome c family protein